MVCNQMTVNKDRSVTKQGSVRIYFSHQKKTLEELYLDYCMTRKVYTFLCCMKLQVRRSLSRLKKYMLIVYIILHRCRELHFTKTFIWLS